MINDSKQIKYSKPRFYVDENTYQQLIKNPSFDLVINIIPQNAKKPHPKGLYVIPNNVAINFIKSKIFDNDGELTYNWKNHGNWHSANIPKDLTYYFQEKNF